MIWMGLKSMLILMGLPGAKLVTFALTERTILK